MQHTDEIKRKETQSANPEKRRCDWFAIVRFVFLDEGAMRAISPYLGTTKKNLLCV